MRCVFASGMMIGAGGVLLLKWPVPVLIHLTNACFSIPF
jgi:hypothetical protein